MRPRRYSAVMNMTATMTTMVRPTNVPTSVWVIVVPMPDAPATDGAMSPDPVTVKPSAVCWNPPCCCASALSGPPIAVPDHAWSGQVPSRPRLSNVAVSCVGPPSTPAAPSAPPAVAAYCGEVANSPASTVVGRPARCAVPTVVQWIPSVDSAPVTASPTRVSRSQRGDCRRGGTGSTGDVVRVVVLHPYAVTAGDHDRDVRRAGSGARLDDEPGLGPRHHARARRRSRPSRPVAAVGISPVSDVTRTVMLPSPASD